MIALSRGSRSTWWSCISDRGRSRASLHGQPRAGPELAEGAAALHRQFGKLELRRYFEDRSGTESAAYLAGAVEVTG